jgi:hypothetical protein
MATTVATIRAQLRREINVPGVETLPDITNSELDGYIKDGFWEARLLGMLSDYTQTDGTEFATPPGEVIKATADDGDLPGELQILVAIMGAMKMIRMKILNLAINFRAQAGPVEYEQQASATTLRAILAVLEARIQEIKEIYSEEIGGGVFVYFDSVLQREASAAYGNLELQVV